MLILKNLTNFLKERLKNGIIRQHSSHSSRMKVTVIGAAGRVGQPLCLMLKQSPLIEELCVHDLAPTIAFATELNHIDTNCHVTSFTGTENLEKALKHSKVVVVLAAAPEADFLPFDKMWGPNAEIVQDIIYKFSKFCPRAMLAIGTNPINSMVPMACEILRKCGTFNPNGVFGITSLNGVRANTFVAQVLGLEPECVVVPVIGGNTEETIIPLLSKTQPPCEFTNEELAILTANIRRAQDKMLKLKHPDIGAFSCAFASARFVISLVKALHGQPEVIETAYVPSKSHPALKYLATPLILGPNGVAANLNLPHLSDYESCLFENSIRVLMKDIKRGEEHAGVSQSGSAEKNINDNVEVNNKIFTCAGDNAWEKRNEL